MLLSSGFRGRATGLRLRGETIIGKASGVFCCRHERRDTTRRQLWGGAIALIPTLALAACQTDGTAPPAMSLNEARQITAGFSSSFTPPPKSIDDLLVWIPSRDADPGHCARFSPQTDEEFREVMASLPPPRDGSPGRVGYAEDKANREFELGNYSKSVAYMEAALDAVPLGLRGFIVTRTAKLATFLAYAGEYEAAEDATNSAAGLFNTLNTIAWRPDSISLNKYLLKDARAAVTQSRGRLIEAEAHYRLAMEFNGKMAFPRAVLWGKFTRVELAGNLARQGRLLEAETVLREVIQSQGGDTIVTAIGAKAIGRLGAVFYEQGRYTDAETLARGAVRLYEALCTASESLSLAAARDVLGKSLVAQSRWADAIETYEAARQAMANDPGSFERLFAGNLYRALALLRTGRRDEAEAALDAALQRTRARLGGEHYKTAEILGFLAMARAVIGDRAGALEMFDTATGTLLTRTRDSDDEDASLQARDRRLALILGAYMNLLQEIRGTPLEEKAGFDTMAKAFRLAEVARVRSVQRAVSASGARSALTDPDLADLARREQDTQLQITALYGTLATMLSDPGKNAQAIEVRATINQLRSARAAINEEIGRRFPDYAELIDPKPSSIADARGMLRPGEALIATYVAEDRTFVWAVPFEGESAFATANLGADDLAKSVNHLRQALEPNASTLGDIPDYDVDAAYDLYRKLLEPVATSWKTAESLLFVAHGPLGYLPFGLLPTSEANLAPESAPLFVRYRNVPWLIRSHAVTVVPSVTSLGSLRALPASSPDRKPFVGFADPLFDPTQSDAAIKAWGRPVELSARGYATRGLPLRLRAAPETTNLQSASLADMPRLPDTADEIRAIAVALDADLTQAVFTGAAANEGAVKTLDLSGYRVIAFATHGLIPGDLDGLAEPALALSAKGAVGGEEDGLLTMGEILGLRLDADWVVLSACNTGSGQGAGAEAVSGLGRAFFYAGTRAVLVSNWPVETISAKTLTTDLFRRQAKDPTLDRAQALRLAILGLMDGEGFTDSTGATVFTYGHPIFWAPFSLVGDPGASGAAIN